MDRAERNKRIVFAFKAGESMEEIADRHKLTVRTVEKIIRQWMRGE